MLRLAVKVSVASTMLSSVIGTLTVCGVVLRAANVTWPAVWVKSPLVVETSA